MQEAVQNGTGGRHVPQKLAPVLQGSVTGNNQSGGLRRRSRIKAGNRSLRSALIEAANAAAKKKNCYLRVMYQRLASRRGRKRALVAVARTILQSAYFMIKGGVAYQDLGAGKD